MKKHFFSLSLSQRVCDVSVRVAFASDAKDKNLLGSREYGVFQQQKSTQHIRNDLLGGGLLSLALDTGLTVCKARSCKFNSSALQCCIDCWNKRAERWKKRFVMFRHILLQVFPKTQTNELQQLASSVLCNTLDISSSKPISLTVEHPSETVAIASDQ